MGGWREVSLRCVPFASCWLTLLFWGFRDEWLADSESIVLWGCGKCNCLGCVYIRLNMTDCATIVDMSVLWRFGSVRCRVRS